MLSIGKLAKGQEGYYLDAVARGAEDYYLEGEAPGRWLGAGTALLGLEGEVDSDALAAVLDGRDPTTGTSLRSSPGGRVPGFDLTFRAPKDAGVRHPGRAISGTRADRVRRMTSGPVRGRAPQPSVPTLVTAPSPLKLSPRFAWGSSSRRRRWPYCFDLRSTSV